MMPSEGKAPLMHIVDASDALPRQTRRRAVTYWCYLISTRGHLFYDSLEPGEFPCIWDEGQNKWKKISVMSEELLGAAPITHEKAHFFMETGKGADVSGYWLKMDHPDPRNR